MSQKWNYNGQEFEVDLLDADFADKYEAAFDLMEKEEKVLLKAGNNSAIIRSYCEMFFHLFDGIYGPGTAKKLFDDKVNVAICDDAYGLFIDAAKQSAIDAAQRKSEALARYAPKQSRQQRQNTSKGARKSS